MERFAAQIAQGVELLNEKVPGWQEKIDLAILNLSTTRCCILGQLYGDYRDGLEALEITHGEEDYGFYVEWPNNVGPNEHEEQLSLLTQEWYDLLKK